MKAENAKANITLSVSVNHMLPNQILHSTVLIVELHLPKLILCSTAHLENYPVATDKSYKVPNTVASYM